MPYRMNRTLLAIASPRSGTIVSMQNVASTVSAAKYPTKSIHDIGLPVAPMWNDKSGFGRGRRPRTPTPCDLTIPMVSVGGGGGRNFGCCWIFRSVGQALVQAYKSKYGQRKDAIDDQHTPSPISQHAVVFRR